MAYKVSLCIAPLTQREMAILRRAEWPRVDITEIAERRSRSPGRVETQREML